MKPHEFFRHLACATIGMDDGATAAWLEQRCLTEHVSVTLRVRAHWDNADEELQEAIGTTLGWMEPSSERCPVHPTILKDYTLLQELACGWLPYVD